MAASSRLTGQLLSELRLSCYGCHFLRAEAGSLSLRCNCDKRCIFGAGHIGPKILGIPAARTQDADDEVVGVFPVLDQNPTAASLRKQAIQQSPSSFTVFLFCPHCIRVAVVHAQSSNLLSNLPERSLRPLLLSELPRHNANLRSSIPVGHL